MAENEGEVQQPEPVNMDDYLPKDQVNKLVQARVNEVKERTMQEAQKQYEMERQKMMQEQQEQQQMQQAPQNMGGMQQASPDEIARQVRELVMSQMQEEAEEQQRAQQKQQVQSIINAYAEKMATGKDYFDDFDEVLENFEPAAFPEIVALVSGMDNAPQVIYELAQNPNKLASVAYAASRSEKMGRAALQKIAGSIEANQAALNAEGKTSEPISHHRPSVKAGADNGNQTVSDLRKLDFLRG